VQKNGCAWQGENWSLPFDWVGKSAKNRESTAATTILGCMVFIAPLHKKTSLSKEQFCPILLWREEGSLEKESSHLFEDQATSEVA
jgi:hypothetical protein